MQDHYKLYEGYVKKANERRKILNEFKYSEIEGNQTYSPLRAVSIDYMVAARAPGGSRAPNPGSEKRLHVLLATVGRRPEVPGVGMPVHVERQYRNHGETANRFWLSMR
jgi:hypothetical protein